MVSPDEFLRSANPQWAELPNAEDPHEEKVECECGYKYFAKFYPPVLDRDYASRARVVFGCPGCGKDREAFAQWVPHDRSAGMTGNLGGAIGDPGSFGGWNLTLNGWKIRIRRIPTCPMCKSSNLGTRRKRLRRITHCKWCGTQFKIHEDTSIRFLESPELNSEETKAQADQ